jgi:RNA polymerase sigma-70 factor, ECF subfamily
MKANLHHIITGCLKGKAKEQEQLYHYCFDTMFKVCLRYTSNQPDAEACYNEALFTVLTKIGQYNFTGEFMGWVRRIVVNTCLNFIQRNKKHRFTEINETIAEGDYTIENISDYKYQSEEIMLMVQQLPRQSALAFNLYVMEGFSYKEISEMLQININTTKWHLNNARILLKTQLLKKVEHENYKNAQS